MKGGGLIILRGEPREFLQEALGNGLLNGDALRAAQAVMAENTKLRNENLILKGLLAENRRVIRAYREDHLAALRYQFDADRGWRRGAEYRRHLVLATAGVTAAVLCLVYSLITL